MGQTRNLFCSTVLLNKDAKDLQIVYLKQYQHYL